jgi:uncharacterized tellurite resistance protein B-like protein
VAAKKTKKRAQPLLMATAPTLRQQLEDSLVITELAPRALKAKVDRLGDLNAEIARLTEKADELKAELKATGRTEIVGSRFRAVISTRESTRLDTAIVKGFLTVEQIIAASKTQTSTAISLYDR